jgi:hypothetical protein
MEITPHKLPNPLPRRDVKHSHRRSRASINRSELRLNTFQDQKYKALIEDPVGTDGTRNSDTSTPSTTEPDPINHQASIREIQVNLNTDQTNSEYDHMEGKPSTPRNTTFIFNHYKTGSDSREGQIQQTSELHSTEEYQLSNEYQLTEKHTRPQETFFIFKKTENTNNFNSPPKPQDPVIMNLATTRAGIATQTESEDRSISESATQTNTHVPINIEIATLTTKKCPPPAANWHTDRGGEPHHSKNCYTDNDKRPQQNIKIHSAPPGQSNKGDRKPTLKNRHKHHTT